MNTQIRRVFMTLLMSMICFFAFAQKTIHGAVKDASGEPMIGVTVSVDGKAGAVTDLDGNFTINNVSEKSKLKISYIGYVAQTINVGSKSQFDITMQEDAQTLEDVVVVGYGTMKKSDLTGSVSSVGTEKLNAKGAPSLMENLQGATPGVNITQNSGRVGGGFDIEIRGKSSINSSTTPLYVVDGVMCDDIDWLNPQDIERIDVLKDASSTAIYGSRATAGVVMVTTKSGTSVKKDTKATISYDGYYGITKTTRMPDFMDGQSFYKYRFMKFLSYGSTENALLSLARPSYKMEQGALEQGLLYDGTNYVMKQMLATGNTYDWPSLVTGDGEQQNHYLAVSGSNDKLNYHVGLGYNKVDGIYEADKQDRINFKGSLDAKISKLVSIGFNINMARQKNKYANDAAVQDAYRMNPYMVPFYLQDQYDKDGAWHEAGQLANFPGNAYTLGTSSTTSHQFTDAFNPLMQFKNTSKQRETWRALGNFYVQLDFMKGLNFKTTFSPNFTYYREGYYKGYEDPTNPGHTYDVTTTSPYIQVPMTDDYTWSEAYYNTNRSFQWTWDNVINWNKTFKDIHSVGLMGLFSVQSYDNEVGYWAGTNTKLVGSDWYAMQNLTHNATDSYTRYNENSMMSYAIRANYGYKSKYLLTATVRWDGSSKFADGQRWGSFPSVAAAWRITEENFMKKINWISNLKLRLSYGVTGNNTGIGNYATQSVASRYGIYPGMTTGFISSGVVDKLLKWEKSHEFNVGLDFGFLRNRITGSIDWYTKKSTDLLYNVTLPLEAGLNGDDPISLTTNIGSVRNTGLEIALNGVIIDTKDLNWTVSANFSTNKNKVLEINGVGDRYVQTSSVKKQVESSLFVGQSYNALWGYKYDGVVTDRLMTVPDNKAAIDNGFVPGEQVKEYEYYYKVYGIGEGLPKVVDTDGNGKIESNDRQFFRGDPKFTGTFTSNLYYKGWDLGFSVYAKIGQYAYSSFLEEYLRFNDRGRQHLNMDYYIPAGTLIDCDGVNADGSYINPVYQETTHYGIYPFPNNAAASSGLGAMATQFDEAKCITKASFVKVKNITLGYTFPKQWLKPWGCQYLRLYFTVTNPFVITDYKGFDPEWASASRSSDGPSTVTYQIGASIKF